MFENFMYDVSIWGGEGFLGTRADFSIDLLISFLASLPILVGIAILFVSKGYLRTHKFFQLLLFATTTASLAWFGYHVHYQEGLQPLISKSSIASSQVYLFLGVHGLLSLILVFKWLFSILHAISDRRRRALPGLYSQAHIKAGKMTFLLVFLTTHSSVGIYWTLFVA